MPTEAHKRANARWDAKNLTVLTCKMRREKADAFKAAAAAHGTTPHALMRGWIDQYLAETTPPQERE